MAPPSLDNELDRFYETHAKIDPRRMRTMTDNYIRFKGKTYQYLREKLPFHIGELVDIGSHAEGVKVKDAEDFDALIPLKISELHWNFVNVQSDQSLVGIVQKGVDDSIPNDLKCDGCLSANLVRESFRMALQVFADSLARTYRDITVELSTQGSVITLTWMDTYRKLLSINLLPSVKLGKLLVVPNAEGNRSEKVLWRRWGALEESQYLQDIPFESKKVLMIIKALRLRHDTMVELPSRVYKVTFVHWYQKNDSTGKRITTNVFSYLSYLLNYLNAQSEEESTHLGNGQVNMVTSYSAESPSRVASSIKVLIESEPALRDAISSRRISASIRVAAHDFSRNLFQFVINEIICDRCVKPFFDFTRALLCCCCTVCLRMRKSSQPIDPESLERLI
ncbi:hypothetical protein CAPTEDRAFT_216949 [Capitella teleta]|uniref:Mab-21-like nucleotidyltransferase domain-containing protein n=1 Tax=Capitella teleta TaxID=283909 RepID=R7T5B1_CAPTE|nr:hypothetical protein CAPTEDRAFT_216949 [Capitella teleta]|eukprot:ELT88161.1 hypothetical protein CAPTEDRAFT_216949 [Capitella teleta]